MWQDAVAFIIVALTFGIVVTRGVRRMRAEGSGSHCANCPAGGGTPKGARPALTARARRPLIAPSALSDGKNRGD